MQTTTKLSQSYDSILKSPERKYGDVNPKYISYYNYRHFIQNTKENIWIMISTRILYNKGPSSGFLFVRKQIERDYNDF